MNENENTTTQNLWDTVKAVLRGNFLNWVKNIYKTLHLAAASAKSLQSCPTLCDPIDGSPIPRILQARTLEWISSSLSNA